MKTLIKLCLVTFSTFLYSHINSQVRPSLSIGAELGIPLFSNHKAGIGGSVKAAFPVGSDLDITASAGYIHYPAANGEDVSLYNENFIPVKIGARYRFVPGGFYFEPQLGYTSINSPGSTKASGGFTYAANAGYMFNKNLDLAVRYEAVSLKNNLNYPQIGFRLAYSFSL